jgi:hypothetical protein
VDAMQGFMKFQLHLFVYPVLSDAQNAIIRKHVLNVILLSIGFLIRILKHVYVKVDISKAERVV